MKKYKLIKEYPGSHKISENFVYTGNPNYYIADSMFTPEEMILNKDFFQEIVEKDYEILSFKQNSKLSELWLPYSNHKDKWSRGGYITSPYTTEEILKHDMYSIHSVKRLSDSEVFTVGDKFMWNTANTAILEINDFKISNNSINVGYYSKDKYYYSINSIKKARQKLFTTEDGVDIFEGDIKYIRFVDTKRWDIGECQVGSNITINPFAYNAKLFSTKEKAEEYILLNKPIFSLNEWKKHFTEIGIDFYQTKIWNSLLLLGKEKLKQ